MTRPDPLTAAAEVLATSNECIGTVPCHPVHCGCAHDATDAVLAFLDAQDPEAVAKAMYEQRLTHTPYKLLPWDELSQGEREGFRGPMIDTLNALKSIAQEAERDE